MRKPKLKFARAALSPDILRYIFIACICTRSLGAFGKVRAVTRPLKIHDSPRQISRAFGLPCTGAPFQPNSFSFIIVLDDFQVAERKLISLGNSREPESSRRTWNRPFAERNASINLIGMASSDYRLMELKEIEENRWRNILVKKREGERR